jgi:LPXTG-site transpeptidase (sortase) family protein
MRSETSRERKQLAVIIFGLLFFAALIFYYTARDSRYEGYDHILKKTIALSDQAKPSRPHPDAGWLMRLKIPTIGVDSVVTAVGLTPKGAMDVPQDPRETAWFNLGPRPGESGSAVIAGHYDWKNNEPAVFNNLHELKEGDMVYLEDETGETTVFVVRETRIYDKDADATDVFGPRAGKISLNLVTCMGAWDKEAKTYSDRLVVFTDKK